MIPVPALLGLAAATLVSEDAACGLAGALIARGDLPPAWALAACWSGIVLGDILLFLAGRHLGGWPPLRRRLRRFEGTSAGRRLAGALDRGLPLLLMGVRFLPGARLPTYVAAGAFGVTLPVFATFTALGAAASTVLLVGIAAAAAAGASGILAGVAPGIAGALVGGGAAVTAARLVPASLTWRARRRLIGRWRRLTRWEFWPAWLFYMPVVVQIVRLALRHRSLTLFTAANPAIPTGGLVGESKAGILRALAASGAPVAPFRLLSASDTAERRAEAALRFVGEERGGMPVVVKPDRGQRGEGVRIVRDVVTLAEIAAGTRGDLIIQRHVPGPELGIFYVRAPGRERGRIFSVTRKVIPEVVGDGERTLEDLILADERAVCMASLYIDRLGDRRSAIPSAGERVPIAEIGNHCRGAVFEDGSALVTSALERAVNAISVGYDGFYFGRYDLKAPSLEHFREGREISIIELNGVGSESTDIYDARNRLGDAYRRLFEQWRLAFETGGANRARGHAPLTIRELARALA
jgi:membrane protein DedA with SNARE-associated domain